ncbi:restriction endonuclease subunit S [Solibacillus sp. FSL W7-1472]|uniref:restriction endonuclease subunit S n=1 Tax=Solibacillus sp. FSL W7-1472 TaxID=2921707 RepID=UPI0030D9E2E0
MVSDKWQKCSWGEISELKYGKALKGYKEQLTGIRVFGTNGPIGYTNKALAEGPSVIIGRKGAYRGVHFTKDPFYVIDTAFYLVPKVKMNLKWAFYELLQKDINSMDSGSAIPSTSREDFYSLESIVPPLNIQNKIVSTLDLFESKIDNNNSIIRNLEEQMSILFKRWFIDFGFPNDQGLPYRSSGGEMVESELGEIPKGWSVATVNELGEIVGGGTPSKKQEEYYMVDGIPWITPKDLSSNKSKFIYKGNLDISQLGLAKSSAKLMQKGTVLLSSRAPIGYIAFAGTDVTTNQGFKSIVPNKSYSEYFIYFKLKEILPIIEANAGGSTFKEISGSGLKAIQIILPENEIVDRFHDIALPLFEQIKNLELEIGNLVSLRDSLLPRLLSGEIEIPDESVVEPS